MTPGDTMAHPKATETYPKGHFFIDSLGALKKYLFDDLVTLVFLLGVEV